LSSVGIDAALKLAGTLELQTRAAMPTTAAAATDPGIVREKYDI
jgi:hypothetical protein